MEELRKLLGNFIKHINFTFDESGITPRDKEIISLATQKIIPLITNNIHKKFLEKSEKDKTKTYLESEEKIKIIFFKNFLEEFKEESKQSSAEIFTKLILSYLGPRLDYETVRQVLDKILKEIEETITPEENKLFLHSRDFEKYPVKLKKTTAPS